MKKLFIILFAFALLTATSVKGQDVMIRQIAFGTKTADSLSGGAPAGGTSKYFYFNTFGTVASGLVKATQMITNYSIYSIQVQIGLPTKAADMVDSCQITFEISYDNTNWYKWSNAGATTVATQTQYEQGGPKVNGSGVYTYLVSARDMVTTAATAGGVCFMPKGCYAPYSRVKITSFKASASAYPKIYYTLKKIN